jgi:hypothetical protein
MRVQVSIHLDTRPPIDWVAGRGSKSSTRAVLQALEEASSRRLIRRICNHAPFFLTVPHVLHTFPVPSSPRSPQCYQPCFCLKRTPPVINSGPPIAIVPQNRVSAPKYGRFGSVSVRLIFSHIHALSPVGFSQPILELRRLLHLSCDTQLLEFNLYSEDRRLMFVPSRRA